MESNSKIPKVVVAMAVYNGAKWVVEQINSILVQVCVDVTIIISIDPSIDDSEKLCNDISSRNSNIIILPGIGRFGGAAPNFFRLIRDIDIDNFDYLALSDQDDIWLSDKLAVAIDHIKRGQFSAYSGSVTAFWPDGRYLLIDKSQPQRKYDYLFESAGPGCSYVLKSDAAMAFREFLVDNWAAANEVSLHDWLIYAWFRANELSWYIDGIPKMLYRQHSNNQIGVNYGLKAIINRFNKLRSGWYRQEIRKIINLLRDRLYNMPLVIFSYGKIPYPFLFMNLNQTRRRYRDRLFFFVIVILGIY
jgi:rhamnosyltransferase